MIFVKLLVVLVVSSFFHIRKVKSDFSENLSSAVAINSDGENSFHKYYGKKPILDSTPLIKVPDIIINKPSSLNSNNIVMKKVVRGASDTSASKTRRSGAQGISKSDEKQQ